MLNRPILSLPVDAAARTRPPKDATEAVSDPDKMESFIYRRRLSEKMQIAADRAWIDVHESARDLILAIETAPNRADLMPRLRYLAGMKGNDVTRLVLHSLIFYRAKDKSAKSRDLGIQTHFQKKALAVADVPRYMTEYGGAGGTYKIYRDENRAALKGKKPKNNAPELDAQVKQQCQDGESVVAIAKLDNGQLVDRKLLRLPAGLDLDVFWNRLTDLASDLAEVF